MTTPSRVVGSQDGPQLTVNWFLKQPNRVRNIMLDMFDAQFIGDALLRRGPAANSGAVVYSDPTPLFADGEAEIVAEFGEIPGVETPGLLLRTKATTKRGLAVKISREMRDRNDVGTLQDRMRQVRNTIVRTWDSVFMDSVYGNAQSQTSDGTATSGVPFIASSGGWDTASGTSTIRADIAEAMERIMSAFYGDDEDNKFGYSPDTLVINNQAISYFLDSEEVNKVFAGSPLADEQPRYVGKLPNKFFGLNVMASWQVPTDTAMVMQRNMLGFISDERPLNGTPLYEDRPRETWRSDFTRTSVVGIDNPESACIITNIRQT